MLRLDIFGCRSCAGTGALTSEDSPQQGVVPDFCSSLTHPGSLTMPLAMGHCDIPAARLLVITREERSKLPATPRKAVEAEPGRSQGSRCCASVLSWPWASQAPPGSARMSPRSAPTPSPGKLSMQAGARGQTRAGIRAFVSPLRQAPIQRM